MSELSARWAQARGWLPFVALVVVVVVTVVVLAPRGGGDGPPLDPGSAKGLGTRALVETLEALGARVLVTDAAPTAEWDSALVLADDLPASRRDALRSWVEAGGTLLVADPSSPLVPFERAGAADIVGFDADIDKRCDAAALHDVGRVSVQGAAVFRAPASSERCYPRGDGHWLVAGAAGRGTVVAVGGAGAFVNRHLDEADNAAVAAAVLVPRRGTTVAFLRPPPPGAGRRTLGDLVSPRVKAAGWQLAIAFLVVAAWRARRLGRPVLESRPVELAGSELVVSVGNLLHRTGRRDRAAELLRDDLRRELADRLGLPRDAADTALSAAAGARAGHGTAAADRLANALAGGAPRSDAELVQLAHELDAVRREVMRAPAP